MPHITIGSSARLSARVTAFAVLACVVALTGPAGLGIAAAAKSRKSSSKTFILPANTTRTLTVGYPFALKFKGAKYSCTAKVSGLGKRFVKILRRGSAFGGSVCRVKARNSAKLPSLDTTAKVRVTATTTY